MTPYAKIVTVLCGKHHSQRSARRDNPYGGTHNSAIQNIQQGSHVVVVNIFLGRILAITGGKSGSDPRNTSVVPVSVPTATCFRPLCHKTYGKVRTWFLWFVTEMDADLESSFRMILMQSSSGSLLIFGRSRAAIRILWVVDPATMSQWS